MLDGERCAIGIAIRNSIMRQNVRQLRQVLMYWPINYEEPKIKLSLADDPTQTFSRQPDKMFTKKLANMDLVVYYFGADRHEDEILTRAYYL